MLVKCKSNLGKTLPKSIYTSVRGYYENLKYPLVINRIYGVFGVSHNVDGFYYLVLPENYKSPLWLPTDLFSVEDPRIPSNWYFEYYGYETPKYHDCIAMLGYKELVTDPSHASDLMELEEIAVRIFMSRKREVEEMI